MPTYDYPYSPLFGSLSDQKTSKLATKYAQKKEKLTPTPPPVVVPPVDLSFENTGDQTGLVDLGQASLYRAGGNLADAGRGISNKLFGTKFDDSRDDGYSDPLLADEAAGVSKEYRTNLQQGQHQVVQDLANDDYLGAAGSALKVAIPTAMDSAATLAEIGAGSLATALTGGLAGPAVFGKKVKDAAETVDKIGAVYDEAKALKEATTLGKALQKAKNLPKATAKLAGQASVLTADLTMQQVQDYREKYGEDPSPQRLAAMTLGVLATSMLEPLVITKLFVPSFKNEFIKEGKTLAKNLGEGSNLVNIAKRIAGGITKMGAAGAGEAGQEYLQTWQEIFSTSISPEEADNLWKAVASKIDDPKLRDQALAGAFLGAAAGGATRGAISAPSVAAGSALDLTKATAKGAAKTALGTLKVARNVAQDVGNKVGAAALTETERDVIRSEYESRKVVTDQFKAKLDKGIEIAEKATKVEDFAVDEELNIIAVDEMNNLDLTEEDLKTPESMKKLQNRIVRRYKADKVTADTELEASNAARYVKKAGENISSAAVTRAKALIKKVPVEQVVETVQKYGETAVKTVKELNSSTALGLVELGLKGGKNSSKVILTAANDLEVNELQRVTSILKKARPKLGKQLENLVESKKTYAKRFGLRTEELINSDQLPSAVKDLAKSGKLDSARAADTAVKLQRVLAGTVADKETLATVKAALAAYKESDAYNNRKSGDGTMHEGTMKTLENRISNAESRLNKQPTVEKVKQVAEKAGEKVSEVITSVEENEKVNATLDKIKTTAKKVGKVITDFNEKLDREEKVLEEGSLRAKIEHVQDNINNPEMDVKEFIVPLAKKLNSIGYATQEDFDDLFTQFPGLAANEEFVAELQKLVESDVILDVDNRIVEPVDSNILVQLYESFNRGCKK